MLESPAAEPIKNPRPQQEVTGNDVAETPEQTEHRKVCERAAKLRGLISQYNDIVGLPGPVTGDKERMQKAIGLSADIAKAAGLDGNWQPYDLGFINVEKGAVLSVDPKGGFTVDNLDPIAKANLLVIEPVFDGKADPSVSYVDFNKQGIKDGHENAISKTLSGLVPRLTEGSRLDRNDPAVKDVVDHLQKLGHAWVTAERLDDGGSKDGKTGLAFGDAGIGKVLTVMVENGKLSIDERDLPKNAQTPEKAMSERIAPREKVSANAAHETKAGLPGLYEQFVGAGATTGAGHAAQENAGALKEVLKAVSQAAAGGAMSKTMGGNKNGGGGTSGGGGGVKQTGSPSSSRSTKTKYHGFSRNEKQSRRNRQSARGFQIGSRQSP